MINFEITDDIADVLCGLPFNVVSIGAEFCAVSGDVYVHFKTDMPYPKKYYWVRQPSKVMRGPTRDNVLMAAHVMVHQMSNKGH